MGILQGYQACIETYRVMYFNATYLFAKLKMAKADGSHLKELAKIERQELIIADAITDRLIHQAHRIELSGESMRKKKQL